MSCTTKPYEEKMSASVNHLVHELAAIRAGRANPAILDKVAVDYYGSPTPINQMAGVKTPDAHMLVIEPWDKGVLGAIEHAIMESDLGVTPNNDGSVIRLPFPALTEDRRRELVKQCKKEFGHPPVNVFQLGCVVSANTGPDALAITFLGKDRGPRG